MPEEKKVKKPAVAKKTVKAEPKKESVKKILVDSECCGGGCCSMDTESLEESTSCCTENKAHSHTHSHCFSHVVTALVSSLLSIAIVFSVLFYIPFTSFFMDKSVEKGIERFIEQQQGAQKEQAEQQQQEQAEKIKNVRPVDETDHLRGNVSAPVSIIEYSDYECPYCKRNHPTVEKVFANYDGQVNWVYRHLPLEFHLPNAQDEAEAAECVGDIAGSEAFWNFTDAIYERTNSNKSFPFEALAPLAVEMGVEKTAFEKCMEGDAMLPRIKKNMAEAESMQISGTPANIIRNNKTGEVKMLGGAYPYEDFTQIIDAMIQ